MQDSMSFFAGMRNSLDSGGTAVWWKPGGGMRTAAQAGFMDRVWQDPVYAGAINDGRVIFHGASGGLAVSTVCAQGPEQTRRGQMIFCDVLPRQPARVALAKRLPNTLALGKALSEGDLALDPAPPPRAKVYGSLTHSVTGDPYYLCVTDQWEDAARLVQASCTTPVGPFTSVEIDGELFCDGVFVPPDLETMLGHDATHLLVIDPVAKGSQTVTQPCLDRAYLWLQVKLGYLSEKLVHQILTRETIYRQGLEALRLGAEQMSIHFHVINPPDTGVDYATVCRSTIKKTIEAGYTLASSTIGLSHA